MKIIFNKLIDCKVKKIKTQNSQPRLNKTVAPERKPEKKWKNKKKKTHILKRMWKEMKAAPQNGVLQKFCFAMKLKHLCQLKGAQWNKQVDTIFTAYWTGLKKDQKLPINVKF